MIVGPEYQFGSNERQDAEVMAEKASKPMDLSSGGVEKSVAIHEQIGSELAAVLLQIKLSPTEKAIMSCRLAGIPIEDVVSHCQKYGLCRGMKTWEALTIENDIKNRIVTKLRQMQASEFVEKQERGDAPSSSVNI